jgi:uncharacterized protein (TIGR03435 family)
MPHCRILSHSIRTKILVLVISRCLASAALVHAQGAPPATATANKTEIAAPAPLTFDVISIKENKSGTDMSLGNSVPDGISLENASLPQFIAHAYGVDHGMGTNYVSGLPRWAEVTRYDIQLKVAGDDVPAYRKLKGDQTRLMLQAVLADRFSVAAHMGTREVPIYNLVVARGGPKLHISDPADTYPNGIKMPDGSLHGAMLVERGHIIGQQATLSSLLFMFTDFSGRPVVDKTGLTARYDFNLQWTPDEHPGEPAPSDTSGPGLFTALEEQFGLKLEPATGPVKIVIVDHIEKPSEN